MIKNYEVFILGAGFSRGYNQERVPLISDFLEIAENKRTLRPDGDHKELVNFIQKYFGEQYRNVNIETLATFLSTDLVPDVSQKHEFREKLYRQLNRIIISTLYDLYGKSCDRGTEKLYQSFADKLVKKGTHVITFNYDLILDNLLFNTKNWYTVDGYGVHMKSDFIESIDSTERQARGNSKIHYLKLHGSLNWGKRIIPHPYQGDNITLLDNIPPDRSIIPIEYSSLSNTEMINMHYQSYIIPPILTKQELYKTPLLQNIWYKSKQLIQMANKIYIIGYSFPPSDFITEFLFRQALSSSQSMPKEIDVIDIKINKDRINNIFQKCKGINLIKKDVVSFLETYVAE